MDGGLLSDERRVECLDLGGVPFVQQYLQPLQLGVEQYLGVVFGLLR